LCDAAVQLLADDGARGVSHRKVDQAAQVPDGTTSVYFRTRSALLQAVAERVTELDLVDLAAAGESFGHRESATTPSRLAQYVFSATAEPVRSRTKARYELALVARRDPVMAETLHQSTAHFMRLGRATVLTLQPADPAPTEELLDDQTVAAMMFINGVMFGIARGDHPIRSAVHLDRYLSAIVRGVGLDAVTARNTRDTSDVTDEVARRAADIEAYLDQLTD
jgi:AcrR family transcriptional regulator